MERLIAGKGKVVLTLERNSTITFNSAFNFTITAEEALGNWTLNTISALVFSQGLNTPKPGGHSLHFTQTVFDVELQGWDSYSL